jgi:hypothetical protein
MRPALQRLRQLVDTPPAALLLIAALLACKSSGSDDEKAAEAAVEEAEAAKREAEAAKREAEAAKQQIEAAKEKANPSPQQAGAVSIGDSVLAPWSRTKRRYGGKVDQIYGKLAFIKFEDGDSGWVLLAEMKPAGTPAPDPMDDSCAFKVRDKVKAPWSTTKAMYSGFVNEVYGKLALIDFLDGDQGWAACSEMRPR